MLSYHARSRIDGNQMCRCRCDCNCRSRTSRCSSCPTPTTWCIFALSFPWKGTGCTRSRQWGQTQPGQRHPPDSLLMSSSRGMISSDLQTEFTKSQGGKKEFHTGTLKQRHTAQTDLVWVGWSLVLVKLWSEQETCPDEQTFPSTWNRYTPFPVVFIFTSATLVRLVTLSEGK